MPVRLRVCLSGRGLGRHSHRISSHGSYVSRERDAHLLFRAFATLPEVVLDALPRSDAAHALGRFAREVDHTIQGDELVRAVAVYETELPHARSERDCVGTLGPRGERVHEGGLQESHRLVAESVPEGGRLQLRGLEFEEALDGVRHETELTRRIEDDDEVGDGLEYLLLASERVVLFLEFFDELLLPLPAELR